LKNKKVDFLGDTV